MHQCYRDANNRYLEIISDLEMGYGHVVSIHICSINQLSLKTPCYILNRNTHFLSFFILSMWIYKVEHAKWHLHSAYQV